MKYRVFVINEFYGYECFVEEFNSYDEAKAFEVNLECDFDEYTKIKLIKE